MNSRKTPRKSLSLRRKFLRLVLPLFLVCFVIFTGVAVWQSYSYLDQDLQERLNGIVSINAEVLAKPLWSFDMEHVALSLEALMLDTDVQGAEVLNEQSQILVSIGNTTSGEGFFSQPPISKSIEFKSFRGNTRVGELVLYPSSSRIRSGMRKEITRTFTMFTLALIIMITIILLGFKKTISTPIKRLTRAIKLADEKHIRIPVDWDSNDELGDAIQRYNHLLVTLTNQEEALTRASMMKSAFLANMSHEIRTPMNSILGMAEMINESSPLTDEQQSYVATLSNSGQALLETINDILDISKIESGQIELEYAIFSLRSVVEGACDLVAFQAHQKGLDLALRLHPALPKTVMGDPVRLRQILVNLLGNGVKFTHEGTITLLVDPGKDEDIHFTIQDTGIGIPEDRQSTIFQMFSQADSSTTRQYGGTGLGLAISKRLVKLMNGDISVVSAHGQGATFTFSIHLPPSTISTSPVSPSERLQNVPVLLVSPNPIRRLYVGELFSAWGMDGHVAQNRANALKLVAAADQPFQIIILDTMLPEDESRAIVQDLILEGQDAPAVVALTPHVGCQSLDLPSRCHTMSKPVKQIALRETLEAILDEHDKTTNPASAHPGQLPPIKVLLVEDSKANRDLVALYLKETSVQLDEAENGQSALNMVKKVDYDVIVLDLQMPVMDGFEAARSIRSWQLDHDKQPTPLVALTADVMEQTRSKCLTMGFAAYLTKPVRKADLLNTLQEMIDATRAAQQQGHERHVFHVDPALRTLVPKLLQNAEQELNVLIHDMKRGSENIVDTVQTQAHTFRGTFGSYGLLAIADQFGTIETALETSDLPRVVDELQQALNMILSCDIRFDAPDDET